MNASIPLKDISLNSEELELEDPPSLLDELELLDEELEELELEEDPLE